MVKTLCFHCRGHTGSISGQGTKIPRAMQRGQKKKEISFPFFKVKPGNSLVIQWLGLSALTARGLGSVPGQGTKIPQAAWRGQNKKNFF